MTKRYVIRILRKDGTLYDEVFFEAISNFGARFFFNNWWLYNVKEDYGYELRSYSKKGRTGEVVISEHKPCL